MQAVRKPVLRVKRQGRVCTVFVDPVSNLPQSIASFDGDDTAFPMVMKEDEVLGRYQGTYQVVFLDPPNPGTPPEADAHVDESLLNEALEQGNKAAEAYRKQHGITGDGRQERLQSMAGVPTPHLVSAPPVVQQPITPTPPTPQQEGTEWARKVFQDLETLFAKRSVATGKLKKEISAELNAICNFLLRVEPGIKETLVALSERHKQQERVEF
jgi:hypothetical protein